MLRYLIIGKIGSGKTYLANQFINAGLKKAITYTTRPKRENEDIKSHHFVDNVLLVPHRLAETAIDNYYYFVNPSELYRSSFFVTSPNLIIDLAKNTPEINYRIIYIKASEFIRRQRFIKQFGLSKINDFYKQNAIDNKVFGQFEQIVSSHTINLPINIHNIYQCDNSDFANSDLTKSINSLVESYHLENHLGELVKKAARLNIIQTNSENKFPLRKFINHQPHTNYVSSSVYTAYLLDDQNEFDNFMLNYLIKTDL